MRFFIGSLLMLFVLGCQANIKAKATGSKEASSSDVPEANTPTKEAGTTEGSSDVLGGENATDTNEPSTETEQIGSGANAGFSTKLGLAAEACIDPDLNAVVAGTKLTLCDGSEGVGLLVVPAAPTVCVGEGNDNCLLTGTMRAVSPTGLGAKVISGQSVAGVNGTVTPPSDCAGEGSENCLLVGSLRAVSPTGLGAKIISGQTVAGVNGTVTVPTAANVKNGVNFGAANALTGTYPSGANPLSGADGTQDLTASTFLDKIKVTANFEYFDSQGNRHVSSGDGDVSAGNISSLAQIFGVDGSLNASPDPWDVRHGVVVGSTTGKLKVNCRSLVNGYDKTDGLSAIGPDIYDTIEDGETSFPVSSSPWNNDAYFCGYNDPADPSWERVSTATATGFNSVYKDKISGLKWSRGTSNDTKAWDEVAGGASNGALEYCNNLVHGGYSNWRLPTQKEWQAVIAHGIMDLDDSYTGADSLGELTYASFWSSTSSAGNPGTDAWRFTPYLGSQTQQNKANARYVLCVAE